MLSVTITPLTCDQLPSTEKKHLATENTENTEITEYIGVSRDEVLWTSTRNSYGYGKFFIHRLGDLVKSESPQSFSAFSDETTQFLLNALRLQSLMWLRTAVLRFNHL